MSSSFVYQEILFSLGRNYPTNVLLLLWIEEASIRMENVMKIDIGLSLVLVPAPGVDGLGLA